ncbi:protein kinase [Achlya hypogyna]|uniref:Protein kinase n=1 Tax=Achlya hypogyna TaxID=1202772 RepID=A0A1V9Z2A9_ACHHY|nr:protein kinase [Achlya hypogyna]
MRRDSAFLILCGFSLASLFALHMALTPGAGVASHLLRQREVVAPAVRDHVASLLERARKPRKKRCGFGAAISGMDPFDLPLHCGNMHTLKLGEKLGEGFWRGVYNATWQGKAVAVKIVHEVHHYKANIVERHVEEAAVLYSLRHASHVARLMGWCNSTLVVEYFPHNLEEMLFDTSYGPWTTKQKLTLCLEAAKGVAEIHAVHAVHADIQPRQFLVDPATRKLYLNDLNRMRFGGPDANGSTCSFTIGLAKGVWRAPEEYRFESLGKPLDIFSLAMVFWTIEARHAPHNNITRNQVYEQVPEGLRPDEGIVQRYPPAMQDLIHEMWADAPMARPSAAAVVARLEAIVAETPDEFEDGNGVLAQRQRCRRQ